MNYTLHNVDMQSECKSEIQAHLCYYPKESYRVTMPNQIKISRGIKYDGIIDNIGANGIKNKRAGFHKYYMTPNAFELFCRNNNVTLITYLD